MLRPLPHHNATAWSGALLATFGLLVLTQWWWGWSPLLARLGPLRPHGALLLVVAGVALVARAVQHAHHRPVSRLGDAAAVLLLAYPLLALAWSGPSPGTAAVAAAAADPHPGRIAPNTALALLAAGVALGLLRRADAALGWPLKVALAALTALAGSALAGHLLGLEQLYRIATFNVMLPSSAAGLCVLATALWGLQARLVDVDRRSPRWLERRIALRTLATLLLVALGAGGAAFVVMRDNFTDSLQADAHTRATTSALALENTLQTSLGAPRTIVRRPALVLGLQALRARPGDAAAAAALQQFMNDLLGAGLDGIRVHAADGRLLAQAGAWPADAPAVVHPLLAAGLVAELRWQGSHVLHVETPVLDARGAPLGRLVTQRHLWLFDQILATLGAAGPTADAQVCSRRVTDMLCAPSRLHAASSVRPLFDAAGRPASPMARALLGESGAGPADDARGIAVVAGYAPVGESGLGLVVQGDARALYAPLKRSLHLVALVVAGLVGLGVWSLRLRVRPLVQAVVGEQRRTRTILDTSSDAFIAIGVDGRITDWNREATRLFGWTEAEALGQPLAGLIIPPSYREAHEAGFARFVGTGTGPVVNRRTEITGWHRCGHAIPIELSISAVATPEGFVANAFVRDIRARQEAQQALAASERRLHEVLNNLPALVGHFDADERCLFANDVSLKATGLTREQAVGRRLSDGISAAAYALHQPHIAQVLAGRRARFEGHQLREGRAVHYLTDLVPEYGADGRVCGFYLLNYDVSEQKRAKLALEANVRALREAEARMAELALSDPLTGLANRRRLDDRLPEALARAVRERRGLGLMFIDVDHFKRINDTRGHAVGDAVLVQFGARLKAALRGTDFVARLAGDEFVVVLEGLRHVGEAEQVAAKLAAAMRAPMDGAADGVAVSTSIGLAYLPAGRRGTPAELLALADRALYATKARGRDGHSCLQVGDAVDAADAVAALAAV